MTAVLQLSRPLHKQPQLPAVDGVTVRPFGGPGDILPWLALRHQAFARQRIGVRRWTAEDFCHEFVNRWWWHPAHMWLAEAAADVSPPVESAAPRSQLVGSVTLAMRGEADSARPVVHWLMVVPRWRRRGVARLLMAHLDLAAWNTGQRAIYLETHEAWEAAVKLYESLGYRQDPH